VTGALSDILDPLAEKKPPFRLQLKGTS
jgi:hypothetical protein